MAFTVKKIRNIIYDKIEKRHNKVFKLKNRNTGFSSWRWKNPIIFFEIFDLAKNEISQIGRQIPGILWTLTNIAWIVLEQKFLWQPNPQLWEKVIHKINYILIKDPKDFDSISLYTSLDSETFQTVSVDPARLNVWSAG